MTRIKREMRCSEGVSDGVSSIQSHLDSIEATFLVLSMCDKQKALQLIITFLQKLEISTYETASPRESQSEESPMLPAHRPSVDSISRAVESPPRVADGVCPTGFGETDSREDVLRGSGSSGLELKVNSVDNSSQLTTTTPISRKQKAEHLNSDYFWGNECDENSNAGGDNGDVPYPTASKIAKRDRTGNRCKGKRKASKNVSVEEEEKKLEIEETEGLPTDGRTHDEVDAAVVLDKIIECVENGLAYKSSVSEHSNDSNSHLVANPSNIEHLAKRAMKPYLVSLEKCAQGSSESSDSRNSPSTLSCLGCGKVFGRRRNLQTHLQNDHDRAELSCRKCRRAFINPEEWLHHGCVQNSVLDKRKKAISSSPVDIYCCPICQVLVETAMDLQKHLFDHVKNQCRVCLKMHASKKELAAHMQTEHAAAVPETAFICQFCQRRFLKVTALYLHLRVHAKEGEKVCFKCGLLSGNADDFDRHMQAHSLNAQFSCDKCSSTFDRRHHFQSHLRCHQKWDCSMCDEKHSHRRAFEQHCRRDHGVRLLESRTFDCTMCQSTQTFSSRYKLRLHITQMHSEEKPYICHVCKLSFSEEDKLKKHHESETHLFKSGLVPQDDAHTFGCFLCEATFIKKEHLERHHKVHTEDRPYSCSLCPFSCKEKANLKNHMKRHTSNRDFVCTTCGKDFQTKKTLEDHCVYVHSEQRNFACETCPRAFKSKKDLMRHRRSVHANIKPHVCKVCNASFKRMALVRNHLLTAHGVTLPTARVKKFDQAHLESDGSVDRVNAGALVENLLEKGRVKSRMRRIQPKIPDSHSPPQTSISISAASPTSDAKTPRSLPTSKAVSSSSRRGITKPHNAVLIQPKELPAAKDSLLGAMVAETNRPFPSSLPINLSSSREDSIHSGRSTTTTTTSRGRSGIDGSPQSEPTYASSATASHSTSVLTSMAPDSSMTEIVVTVDSDGAIMNVDGTSAPQTFIPIKDVNGETTYVPLPISGGPTSVERRVEYSVIMDNEGPPSPPPPPLFSSESRTILISNDASDKDSTCATSSYAPAGYHSSEMETPTGFHHPAVKALKGLDVRLPPSIAAMEEERVVDGAVGGGISIDASTLPSPSSSTFSPQASPSGGLYRPGLHPTLAYISGLTSLNEGVAAKSSFAQTQTIRSAHTNVPLRYGKTGILPLPQTRTEHLMSPQPQVVTAEDGEAYYLMETDQNEPQEIYYVVSDGSHFI